MPTMRPAGDGGGFLHLQHGGQEFQLPALRHGDRFVLRIRPGGAPYVEVALQACTEFLPGAA